MKWILNLLWLLVVGFVGYSAGYNRSPEESKQNLTCIDNDIGSCLAKAQNNAVDVQSLLQREELPIYGGEFATVIVDWHRRPLKAAVEISIPNDNPLIDSDIGEYEQINMFLDSDFDRYVKENWINNNV